jgi:hypothetical protein
MRTPIFFNPSQVKVAVMENLSYEFGFNSPENLSRIAERSARFNQSSLKSQDILHQLSTQTDFHSFLLREVIILEKVNTLLLTYLHHECGIDGSDISQIHYADRIDGIGLGQVIIPSTELLCKVQMTILESIFRSISFNDFTKASGVNIENTASLFSSWGNGLCGVSWELLDQVDICQLVFTDTIDGITTMSLDDTQLRIFFRRCRLLHTIYVGSHLFNYPEVTVMEEVYSDWDAFVLKNRID